MRALLSLVLAFSVSVSVLFLSGGGVADAAFHCVRIHAVAASWNGNASIQYVELRMDLGGQNLLTGHTIQFFSASGQLKATFTFPAGVTNALVGDSVLIATSEFNANATGGTSDFTFTGANTVGANGGDPLHPVQLDNGSVVWAGPSFACVTVMAPVDALAYGSATAIYGTAAVPLTRALYDPVLRLTNLNIAPVNNSAEYELHGASTTTFAVPVGNLKTDLTTPRNNGRVVLRLGPEQVGGVLEDRDPVAPADTVQGSGSDRSSLAYAGLGAALVVVILGAAGYTLHRRKT